MFCQNRVFALKNACAVIQFRFFLFELVFHLLWYELYQQVLVKYACCISTLIYFFFSDQVNDNLLKDQILLCLLCLSQWEHQLELLNTFLSSDILSFNFITSDNSFFMEKFVYALNIFVRDPFIYNWYLGHHVLRQ